MNVARVPVPSSRPADAFPMTSDDFIKAYRGKPVVDESGVHLGNVKDVIREKSNGEYIFGIMTDMGRRIDPLQRGVRGIYLQDQRVVVIMSSD